MQYLNTFLSKMLTAITAFNTQISILASFIYLELLEVTVVSIQLSSVIL